MNPKYKGPQIKTKYRASVEELHEAFAAAWTSGRTAIEAYAPHNAIMRLEAARNHALGEYTVDSGDAELNKMHAILAARLKSLHFIKAEGAVIVAVDRNYCLKLIEAIEREQDVPEPAPRPAEVEIPKGGSIF